MGLVMRGTAYIARNGLGYTLRRMGEKLHERLFQPYDRYFRSHLLSEAELTKQRAQQQPAGLISVLIPTYNTRPDLLLSLASSLTAQTYADWEAVLYDGHSSKEETLEALRWLKAQDARFRVRFGQENLGISGNSNLAAEDARGDILVLCDHDDLLSPDALWRIAHAFAADDTDFVYSDEDKVTEDGRFHTDPHWKPDFCPDNLRSGNYICHVMAFRRALFDEVGGFRSAYDGSQDHDLALRMTEKARHIVHIPETLYAWRTVASSVSHQHMEQCLDAAARAVTDQLHRLNMAGEARAEHGQIRLRYAVPEKVSIGVILTESGDPNLWAGLVASLRDLNAHDVHLYVVSPWSSSADDLPYPATWVKWEQGMTYASVLNRAAEMVQQDYMLLLHGGIRMQGEGWFKELLMYAQRADVGLVTPMLAQRGKIVFGGFALDRSPEPVGVRGAGIPVRAGGWHLLLRTSHNVAAVSAACCLLQKKHWQPLNERFTGGYALVDLSIRLRDTGLVHVYTPWAVGQCREKNLLRWLLLNRGGRPEDKAAFLAAYPLGTVDPCYSARFSHKNAGYQLPREHNNSESRNPS